MTGIKRFFRIYLTFSRSNIQKRMAYRFEYFLWLVLGILRMLVLYFLWRAVFNSSDQSTLSGFSFEEMTMYIFLMYVTSMTINTSPGRTVSAEVKSGAIAINLIRPVNYHLRFFFEELGNRAHRILLFTLPIWIGISLYGYFQFGFVLPSIAKIGLYFFSLFMGFFIAFFFDFIVGLISFLTTNIWGVALIVYGVMNIMSGRVIPLSFFPDWAQNLMHFFPFESLYYTPLMIYMGKLSGNVMWMALGRQALWIAILFCINAFFWKRSIRRLTIFGG